MDSVIDKIIPNIISWKKKYNNIFYIRIGDNEYIYRNLNRGEYTFILDLQEKLSIDTSDIILNTCLLYPAFDKSKFDKLLAGEVDSILECISNTSGFSATDKVLEDIEKERNLIGTLENQIIVLICKAFPHLTLSDINNFTYEEIMRYLAISESILDVKINIEKPTTKKPGTVDFDKENEAFGAGPKKISPQKPRGEIGK